MIEKIISWSIHNRFFVWVGIVLIVAGGIYSIRNTPVDAIPALSENQVIVYTEWMDRNPQIICGWIQEIKKEKELFNTSTLNHENH